MATFVQALRRFEFTGPAAIVIVASLIGVIFMGSTLVTPLYAMYERAFHFSRLALTLVYAA